MFRARIEIKSLIQANGICCTVAFGMSVNVRTVVQCGPSADVDDYFQESDRDGKPSEAVILRLLSWSCDKHNVN